ncbi:MAG TPA: inorganic diphosphatase [Rhizomicrobium sp.]|nr:inorganic diphosphatase [Rhizomicrobium sp.]
MSHNLIKIPAFDRKGDCCHAVIETPKGSHHKFDYDPDLACFQLKKTLPEGMSFPLDFGFVPSTLADDGDPVDILVVLDFPAAMGALVKVRLIAGIEAEQREKNGKWERNDRLIAVADHSRTLADVKALDDLGPGSLDQLIAFFEQYNKLEDKEFRCVGTSTPKGARALVEKGIKAFKKNH